MKDEIRKINFEGNLRRGADLEGTRKLEEIKYNEARRSMRMWPVPEGNETAEKAARDFMCNVLEIPRITVARIRIDFVRRVSSSRRSRVEDEVLVRFTDSDDRDVVQSFAPSLAKQGGKAGVRLDIPTHLKHVFRLLDAHGAELRKRNPLAKRSIKFGNTTRSLVLDAKIDEEDGWMRIDQRTAEEARKQRGISTSAIGCATPGGKAGRRVLMLPSPEDHSRSAFEQGCSGGWTKSGGSERGLVSETDRTSERSQE